jgi:hypothetical protein
MEAGNFNEDEYIDDSALRDAIDEEGVSEFGAAVGQAIAQGMAANQVSPDAAQAAATEAHARAIIARNPGMQSDDGAQTALGLAQHVAAGMGHPELADNLEFVELAHRMAEGAAAGIGRPVVPIEQQIVAGSSTGNRRGAAALPF